MTDQTTETARALLYRYGLPEDVIDGVLCLHAQELAEKIREDIVPDEALNQLGRDRAQGMRWAADLIDSTRDATPPAPLPVSEARMRLLQALDASYCQALGHMPEGLLAAYEASRTQTVDQDAVLAAAADRIDAGWFTTAASATAELRRMADETAATETAHQPRRGDQFEAWLKTQRNSFGWQGANDRRLYDTLDGILDRYRLYADTGTPLGEHVCETKAVGDCECLEQPATETCDHDSQVIDHEGAQYWACLKCGTNLGRVEPAAGARQDGSAS